MQTTTAHDVLDYYARPGRMTSADGHADLLGPLPREAGACARIIQGLLLHEHLAAPAYGITLSAEQRAESQIRPAEEMLERLRARGAQPQAGLPVEERLVGTCRNFSVLFVAMLRAQGIPARARCGFGGYFVPGFFEDHWVAEYWSEAEGRWVRVDAQIDDVQRRLLRIDFDVLDVPHDRFLIAGDAWARCRAGEADPAAFGLSLLKLSGLWFIAGNLLRDAAALNKVEMLPWDVWGAMPGPDEPLGEEQLAFFDHIAALTRAPDASFDELRALYEGDERLRVPATIFNAIRNQPETI